MRSLELNSSMKGPDSLVLIEQTIQNLAAQATTAQLVKSKSNRDVASIIKLSLAAKIKLAVTAGFLVGASWLVFKMVKGTIKIALKAAVVGAMIYVLKNYYQKLNQA